MKPLCFVLLLALSMQGCMFSKSSRMDRAYYKQLKQVKAARSQRRQQLIQHERAEMPSLRTRPAPSEPQTVVTSSTDQ